MIFTQEHEELRRSTRRFIDTEINPYVDEWEKAEIFPAKELFKKLGAAGFLGITKPTDYGGMGLDYSYGMTFTEELGHVTCGGVPMAIGVQTDMATPALAVYGSDELKAEFLAPSIAGEKVACIGVSEPGAGSDVAGSAPRPGPMARTMSSTATSCGSPTASRPTGSASSPTPARARCTRTSR